MDGILPEPVSPRQYYGGFVEQQERLYNISLLAPEALFGNARKELL